METLRNTFREAIEAGEFVITCETIPGRGAVEVSQEKALQDARELWATGRVHAISITVYKGRLTAEHSRKQRHECLGSDEQAIAGSEGLTDCVRSCQEPP